MAGSVVGFVVEGIWCVMTKGGWQNHSATVRGPFCIVYGFGLIAIYIISVLTKEQHPAVRFMLFAVTGSAIEFCASLFQELCFGSYSWNYSKQFLNIGGRISLKMTVMWGILGVLCSYLLMPPLRKAFDNMQNRFWRVVCVALTVFMAADLALTSAAVLRWRARLQDVPASNRVERILDDRYDDETMGKIFSNLVFIKK